HLQFLVGNILTLDFSDNMFHLTHVQHVLRHVADSIRTLNETHCVIKPGGVVAHDAHIINKTLCPEAAG
ncbi:hypothetical protein POSPLADRAFT_1131002, partial [Postia placenta MAD-698-R-SB12]